MPRADGNTLRYRCADGVRVDVQPLGSRIPDVRADDGPVEVRFGGARHTLRPVSAASGVRYESARVGWHWFGRGEEGMLLRDANAGALLARDCRLMRAGAAG